MTPALVTLTLALIAVAPFAGLPGLAGVSPLAVWFGFGVVLLILALLQWADELADGNVERMEREEAPHD